MSDFDGFPQSGLDFLTTLGTKDKAWFDDNRKQYKSDVADPAKAFVTAMGEQLAERMSPAIEAQPKTNGSIAPINNDLRFSPDAAPYKDHIMFRFWEGPTKKVAPTLMLRMSPSGGIGFAASSAIADVDRWRKLIDDEATGKPFAQAVAALVKETKADVVGADLKRVPKPYATDHPRADLLRHKGFQVRWIEKTPKNITSAKFTDWCVDRLVKTADVHAWLVANLT